MTGGSLGGACILVYQNCYGVLVPELDRFSRGSRMGVDSLGRQFADTNRVGPQKISSFLDMTRNEGGIMGDRRRLSRDDAINGLPQRVLHGYKGSRKRMFCGKSFPFPLDEGSKVSLKRPVEAMRLLMNSLDLILVNLRGWMINLLDCVHWKRFPLTLMVATHGTSKVYLCCIF